MKKKSELTEPDIFYIINSNDEDNEAADKVGCSKRVVTSIRAKNPKQVEKPQEFKPLTFLDLAKQPSQNGKGSALVMSQATSFMGDDATKVVTQTGQKRDPKTNPDYVTTVKK